MASVPPCMTISSLEPVGELDKSKYNVGVASVRPLLTVSVPTLPMPRPGKMFPPD